MILRLASIALLVGVAACNQVTPNNPTTNPLSSGPGSDPLKQAVGAIGGANSPNASGGNARIVGYDQQGRPILEYSGQPGSASGAGTGVVQNPSTVNPTVRQGSRN